MCSTGNIVRERKYKTLVLLDRESVPPSRFPLIFSRSVNLAVWEKIGNAFPTLPTHLPPRILGSSVHRTFESAEISPMSIRLKYVREYHEAKKSFDQL